MKQRGFALAGSWLAAATAWEQAPEPTGPAGSLGASAAVPAELAPAPIEVTVQQARPLVAPTVETRVGGEEGRRAAGTQGDAVKALQALPGLARAGAGAGEVVAWGSAPNESRLYVDGVEIPVLYHGSGIRSVVPSGWVSTLTFLPGAYSSEYGRGLGGVVAVETRALDSETWHAAAQIGHYKELQRLPVRSPRPTPAIAEVLLGDGRGRSFGVQLLARQNLRAGWSGWLAWTISRSERWREDDAPRPFDYDQPHVVAAAVNKRIAGWSLSARIRYASGSPRTPVIGASLNLLTDGYEPLLGALNSTRLPDFFQLDLRVDHTVELPGATLSVYADALNVTAPSNAEDIVYGPDYREWEYLRGLPPLLAIGARIER